jgi:hypothetical protein
VTCDGMRETRLSLFFMIPLREIAFARSGDKGNSANVAVFARAPAIYAWLRDHLTAAAVEEYFRPLGVGRVIRYEVPNLEALNFVLPHVLAGGGSRSLRIDAQGKTLGMALLEMPVEAEAVVSALRTGMRPNAHAPASTKSQARAGAESRPHRK